MTQEKPKQVQVKAYVPALGAAAKIVKAFLYAKDSKKRECPEMNRTRRAKRAIVRAERDKNYPRI